MAEEEKKSRATAKRKFTRLCNRLTLDIQHRSSPEVIDEKYSTLKLLWDDDQSKHDDYLFALHPDQEEPSTPADVEYITQLEEKFEIIQKLKYDYTYKMKLEKDEDMKNEEIQKNQVEVIVDTKIADQKIISEKMLFSQEVDNLNDMLKSDIDGYLKHQVNATLKDLKLRLEKCNDALLTYLRSANGIIPADKQKSIDELYRSYKIVNQRCLTYFENISKRDKEKQAKPVVRLERMRLPRFEGDIRNYARFKSDFERQVEPQT